MASATPLPAEADGPAAPGARPAGAPVIEAIGLTKRYGRRTAVEDLTFEVRPGEVFGLLGPNGAGKTTTVLMLLGLTEPTAGRARVVGVDPTRDPLEVKRRVGYLPDSVGFYDGLSGRANLAYTARLNRIPAREAAGRIDGLLARVGLADVADERVETYSRGMRQRLGIADALVKDPAVLILDEPTVSLDPEGVAEILALIARIAVERGIAILLSSHLLDQVQAVCGRVGIFYAGRLIAAGTVVELAARGGAADDVVELAVAGGADPTGWLRSAPSVGDVSSDPAAPGRLLVRVAAGGGASLAADLVAAGFAPVHLRVREDRLDAIYRRLVHAAAADLPAGRPADAPGDPLPSHRGEGSR
ncbi:MAG: ABC transporter ATP-binding protein [Chloroflexi bacterium]|nr:ABC transporter ATP-binding protein [Chloroflexota bacterium]